MGKITKFTSFNFQMWVFLEVIVCVIMQLTDKTLFC